MLDEGILEEARCLLGERTYSATVNRALTEVVRTGKIRALAGYFGNGWEGDLSEMREDKPRKRTESRPF